MVLAMLLLLKLMSFLKCEAPTQNSLPKALPNLDFGRCFKTDGFMYAFIYKFDEFGQDVSPCPKQPLPGPPKSIFYELR